MTDLFEIQSVPLTNDPWIRDIYFKLKYSDDSHKVEEPPKVSEDRLSIVLPEGAELDLNTYFASFYEAYWHQFTSVRHIAFCLTVTGSALVRLMRYSPDAECVVLSETVVAGENLFQKIDVPAPFATPLSYGRLYASITAITDQTKISDMTWRTPAQPVRDVSIGVNICTIGRDECLASLLGELSYLQNEEFIRQIVIINHAAPGLRERLVRHLPEHARSMELQIVEQEGVGSTGGGARGMIEVIDRGICNYYLRLDDDIVADRMVMRRLPLLMRYVKDKVAIGGFIFNAVKPTENFRTAPRMGPDSFTILLGRFDEDIISDDALNQYAEVEFCDCIAWWCAAVAVDDIKRTGLPLPLFLYYDDVEYAFNLGAHGVQNMYWPGLAIWHEPLNFKRTSYKKYYETRNYLYTLERHRLLNKKVAFQKMRTIFMRNIMQFYYAHAHALVLGMEHFLDGYSILENWDHKADRKNREEIESWEEAPDVPLSPPITLMENTGKAPPFEWMYGPAAVLRIISDMIRPVNKNAPLRSLDYFDGWTYWAASRHDYIAITHSRYGVYHVYRRNPKKVAQLVKRFVVAWFRFTFGDVNKRNRQQLDWLSSQEFWRKKFHKTLPNDKIYTSDSSEPDEQKVA